METSLLATVAVTVAMLGYWHWLHHCVNVTPMSGDKWYIRQMAFTDLPITAPYCWRPLVPRLGRYLGFTFLSYTATLATPVVIYFWVGGWKGFLCAMIFVASHNTVYFSVRNPEYAEGVGQLLMFASVWAIGADSLLAWPLLLLAALCRETLTASLGAIVLFWNPWLLIPLGVGASASWFTRNEDKDNVHPLVEKTTHDTIRRWAKFKGAGAISYAHVFQPFRGLAVAVPFMWDSVGDFSRLGLIGLLPIWLLALPASGQSRIMCYGYALLMPFAAALSIEWLGVLALLAWFWPVDVRAFDETGGQQSFGFVR